MYIHTTRATVCAPVGDATDADMEATCLSSQKQQDIQIHLDPAECNRIHQPEEA